jgi:SAM-dependent methyltransferase
MLDISENFQPVEKGFKRSSLGLLKPNSADLIKMDGVLEQRPGKERPAVMRQIYKALKPGGRAVFTASHWSTAAASMNPFSCWPPISPESLGFFSEEVRKRSNHTKDTRLNDIDFDLQWAEMYPPDWQTRSDKVREFAARHYNNVLIGLAVTMTKKGK